jgi:hypothetical protein
LYSSGPYQRLRKHGFAGRMDGFTVIILYHGIEPDIYIEFLKVRLCIFEAMDEKGGNT